MENLQQEAILTFKKLYGVSPDRTVYQYRIIWNKQVLFAPSSVECNAYIKARRLQTKQAWLNRLLPPFMILALVCLIAGCILCPLGYVSVGIVCGLMMLSGFVISIIDDHWSRKLSRYQKMCNNHVLVYQNGDFV